MKQDEAAWRERLAAQAAVGRTIAEAAERVAELVPYNVDRRGQMV